ncbi:MAG: helix-turn-helix domain-containing protein [Maritimibacter sp.]
MDSIANYNLFGELGDLPDVVHCETIEARSVLHDWEFKPHRHARLHQVLMIDHGAGIARLESLRADLSDQCVVNVPAGCVHSYEFVPGTHGWVVTIPVEVLDQWLGPGEGLRPLLARYCVIDGNPEIGTAISAIFTRFLAQDFARAHMLRAQVALLAGLVAREIAASFDHEGSQDSHLQRKFQSLIETHFTKHLPVSDYAARLNVTPTHLSRVMRAATGRPASAMIEDRVIREARRNLAYSNLSISEIAYALGYNDPAYFSRVFSRATGQSPRAFRAQVNTSI